MPRATHAGTRGKTTEEILKVWRRYKRTKAQEDRNRLVEHYLPIVRYVADRLIVKLPHSVDVEDLESAGIFGLLDAVDRFDLDRDVKFETYCTNRIRGAILDELRSLDWVPRLVRQRTHRLSSVLHLLEARFGRAPSDTEVAKELGMSLQSYDRLLREVNAAAMLSESARWSPQDDAPQSALEGLKDNREKPPSEDIIQRELVDFVSKGLSRKERLILMLYYYEELTMKEIGQTLELSESRVCQIHSRLMVRLREKLRKIRDDVDK